MMFDRARNFWVAQIVEMKACLPLVKSECKRASCLEKAGLSAKSSTMTRMLNIFRTFRSSAAAMTARCVVMIPWRADGS